MLLRRVIGANSNDQIRLGRAELAYQSILGHSDSDSIQKLERLKLPSMRGLSFLDIGSNEGFFCGYALADRASRVVGIDVNQDFVKMARDNFPRATFLCCDWDTFLEENQEHFDIILIASALHYAKSQDDLIKKLLLKLTSTGSLIIEAGIILEEGDGDYVAFDRWDGPKFYPRFSHLSKLFDSLGYSIFILEKSVKQSGDAIERYVLHIRKRIMPVLLNFDPPDSGKTELGKILKSKALQWISLDEIIKAEVLKRNDDFLNNFLEDIAVIQNYIQQSTIFDRVLDIISDLDRTETIYIEGYLNLVLRQRFTECLSARGIPYYMVSAGDNNFVSKRKSDTGATMTPMGVVFLSDSEPRGHIDLVSLIQNAERFGMMFAGWIPIDQCAELNIDRNDLFFQLNDLIKIGRIVKTFERPDLHGGGLGFEAYFSLEEEDYKYLIGINSNINYNIRAGTVDRNRDVREIKIDTRVLQNIPIKTSPL